MSTTERRERERAQRHQLIITAARELAEADGWEAVATRRLAERVEYSQPVLTVQVGNGAPITLGAGGPTVIELPPPLDTLVRLRLGIGEFTEEVSPDGTLAAGAASLLSLDLELLNGAVDLVDLDLAPMAATALAPVGGVHCPTEEPDNPLREVNKHASALEVAPGGEFDYNISVPNRGPCAVTDVVVTDQVSGPDGFEIVATEPQATVEGNTIRWELGTLEPNETRNLTIRIRVPADAQDGESFDDLVHVAGNCDGEPVEEDDEVVDIPTVRDDFEGPCNVGFSNKDASHVEVMPGQTFSYYVHAFNSGAEDCTGIDVTDTLDERLAFVSCNRGCANDGRQVTWNIDRLPGGSSMVLSVVVQVAENATGVLENTAVIDPDNGDPKTVTTTGPTITDRSVPKEPAPAVRGELPTTGSSLPAALALGLGAAATALLALRRRMVAAS